MRTHRTTAVLAIAVVCNSICLAAGEPKRVDDSILRQTFDFSGARSPQPQLFDMETRVITYVAGRKAREHGHPEAPAQMHARPRDGQGRG